MTYTLGLPCSRIRLYVATIAIILACGGCGTFQLSSGAIPQVTKSSEQIQLDNLTCKDQAKLAANTAERQAGAFLLGFTIIGVPVAYELEKSKQREVYKSCMESRGYRVLPPAGTTELATDQASKPTSQPAPMPTNRTSDPLVASPSPQTTISPQLRDEGVQLQKLKELREKNLITLDEYEKKRKEILDRL